MKNRFLLALALLFIGLPALLKADSKHVEVDVGFSTPFYYLLVGEIKDGNYDPWENGVYRGYSGAEGFDQDYVSLTELADETTFYSGSVSIDSLSTYKVGEWYFYMELVAEDGNTLLAYSDLADVTTIQNAVMGITAVPWKLMEGANLHSLVPEPCSGLLLLVGGALLALRRRRQRA